MFHFLENSSFQMPLFTCEHIYTWLHTFRYTVWSPGQPSGAHFKVINGSIPGTENVRKRFCAVPGFFFSLSSLSKDLDIKKHRLIFSFFFFFLWHTWGFQSKLKSLLSTFHPRHTTVQTLPEKENSTVEECVNYTKLELVEKPLHHGYSHWVLFGVVISSTITFASHCNEDVDWSGGYKKNMGQTLRKAD